MTRYLKPVQALLCALLITPLIFSQTSWQPKNLRLSTRWTKDVTVDNALKEYPRPQLVRNDWINLNGQWEYAIADTSVRSMPAQMEGTILVPYPLESALSGVQKRLKANQYLWYKRKFTVAKTQLSGKRTLLHFGAVDNSATVFVNGKNVGSHKGGYTEFSFDMTNALKDGDNELVVRVYDPTDEGVWPHGKQVSNPANIYYTPTSGIWQTVWMETVNESYIRGLRITPDVDKSIVNVNVDGISGKRHQVIVYVMDHGNVTAKKISRFARNDKSEISIPIKNPLLWSPGDPFLYDVKVQLLKGNKVVDEVSSYFGMRKVSIAKDEKGYARILLNNRYLFNLGVLDQGFWPDGLYTAPTDEALAFDVKAIKAMGFNTIRKHIKVEPARWYYHADKLGMLVWQDFVNPNQSLPEGAKAAFETQLNETMDQLYNHPCVTTWVLFNEKWGQYDQQRLTDYVKAKDRTRLLNAHSGEMLWVNEKLRSPSPNAWVSSDIADVHSYPDPMNVPDDAAENKVHVLGEFGGIGVFVPDHQWLSNKSWGYVQVTPAQLQGKYAVMNAHVKLLEREGLSASIYTQPYDVEGEENGLMTYDREVIKIPIDSLRKIHAMIVQPTAALPDVTIADMDLTDAGLKYANALQQYLNGEHAPQFLKKLSMMAAQAGDKNGMQRIGNDYVASLNGKELSDDDMKMVADMTTSSRDAGCQLMQAHADEFKKVLGDRAYTVKMMNLIYTGEIKDVLDGNEDAAPDWSAIESKVRAYGAPGDEILQRAKTVHYFNAQDWDNYREVATKYLEKYGANLRDDERKMFSDALSNGKASTK